MSGCDKSGVRFCFPRAFLIVVGLILTVASAPGANRLAGEGSPYLRAHANNPVDWYPWGEEAFQKARAEDKLIFLSIGYSTCHWCHVMERESFSNPEIAAVLNAAFVCIKVDREQRPDVDRIYLSYLQLTNGSAGWPANLWLTPDLKPVFGGIYFPPQTANGRPGLREVATRLSAEWKTKRQRLLTEANRVVAALAEESKLPPTADALDIAALRRRCLDQARTSFDERHGGFEGAPKFPNAVILDFLLEEAVTAPTPSRRELAQRLAVRTLQALAAGGIHDQLGGGFHRYAVDAAWRTPHFEKMLPDQALLARVLVTGWQLTRDPVLRDAAVDTLAYVQRDLIDTTGAFLSAEDAESVSSSGATKTEGAFYLWSETEIDSVLGGKDAELFKVAYGIEAKGNAGADFAGKNILRRAQSVAALAKRFQLPESAVTASLNASRTKLLALRGTRHRPLRDDKIITAWNGLMISAFARAALVLDEPGYAQTATRAAAFIRAQLRDPATGRLAHSRHGAISETRGFAEDYAFLIQGLLDLYEATGDTAQLQWAIELQGVQDTLFWDATHGGYFASTADDTSVLIRLKNATDAAEPSANSVSLRNLVRLASLLHRDEWHDRAEKIGRAFGATLQRAPFSLPCMIAALNGFAAPSQQVAIHGEAEDPRTRALLHEVATRFLPHAVLLRVDAKSRAYLAARLDAIAALPEASAAPTAYVCENFVCHLPTTDPVVLGRQLDAVPNR